MINISWTDKSISYTKRNLIKDSFFTSFKCLRPWLRFFKAKFNKVKIILPIVYSLFLLIAVAWGTGFCWAYKYAIRHTLTIIVKQAFFTVALNINAFAMAKWRNFWLVFKHIFWYIFYRFGIINCNIITICRLADV